MLTTEELRRICVEHFEAENHRSVDEIIATVDDDVEYHVMSPRYPDDPEPFGVTAGAEAVRQMWVNLYRTFDPYVIEWDENDWMVDAARGQVFARVRITATPVESFEGLPAGKPVQYSVAALCDFNAEGKMTRETVYGNLAIVVWGIRRMREFLQAGSASR